MALEPTVAAPADADWWSPAYLDWFGCQSFKFLVLYKKSNKKLDVDKAIEESFGNCAMVGDSHARPFAPGMALVVILSRDILRRHGTDCDEISKNLIGAQYDASFVRSYGGGQIAALIAPRPDNRSFVLRLGRWPCT